MVRKRPVTETGERRACSSKRKAPHNTKTRLAAGSAADRVRRTSQGGGAGAAVCSFQAPAYGAQQKQGTATVARRAGEGYKTQKPAWQRVFVYRGVGKYIKV